MKNNKILKLLFVITFFIKNNQYCKLLKHKKILSFLLNFIFIDKTYSNDKYDHLVLIMRRIQNYLLKKKKKVEKLTRFG